MSGSGGEVKSAVVIKYNERQSCLTSSLFSSSRTPEILCFLIYKIGVIVPTYRGQTSLFINMIAWLGLICHMTLRCNRLVVCSFLLHYAFFEWLNTIVSDLKGLVQLVLQPG